MNKYTIEWMQCVEQWAVLENGVLIQLFKRKGNAERYIKSIFQYGKF